MFKTKKNMSVLQQRPVRRLNSSSSSASLSSMSLTSSPTNGGTLRRIRTSSLSEDDVCTNNTIPQLGYRQQQQYEEFIQQTEQLSPQQQQEQQHRQAMLYGSSTMHEHQEEDKSENHQQSHSQSLWSWVSFGSPPARRSVQKQMSMDEEKALEPWVRSSLGHDTGRAPQRKDSETSSSSDEDGLYEIRGNSNSTTVTTTNVADDEGKDSKRWKKGLKERLKVQPLDVDQYAAGRVMTKTQEKWNAITMVPPSVYGIYFLWSLSWIPDTLVAQEQAEYDAHPWSYATTRVRGLAGILNAWWGDPTTGCLKWNALPVVPPLPIVAAVVATCCHLPASFLYHWTYAHQLQGKARVNHWSRRLDQAMIHFGCAFLTYATSGSVNYFLACVLFNLDCAYRHMLPHIRPRSNQLRISIAMIAYGLPILRRGDFATFGTLFVICATAGWFFCKYPIGGWSHSAFHLFIGLVPPILMHVAMSLPVTQPQLKLAAQCSVLLKQQ